MPRASRYRFFCQGDEVDSVVIEIDTRKMFYPTAAEIECRGQGALGWLAAEFQSKTGGKADRCEAFRVFDWDLSAAQIERDFSVLLREREIEPYATLIRGWMWLPEGHENGVVLSEKGEPLSDLAR